MANFHRSIFFYFYSVNVKMGKWTFVLKKLTMQLSKVPFHLR